MALGQLHIHNVIRVIILEDELLHLNQSHFFGQSTFKIKLNRYFDGILNLWMVLHTKNKKITVQQITLILQCTLY